MRTRFGAVSVLGNHDHWENARACRDAFARIRVPMVENQPLFLTTRGLTDKPSQGESLCVTGIGDLWEERTYFDKALGGVPEDTPRVLLSHNPDAAENLGTGRRVDLMLSGHTHGGQVDLPGIGTPIVPSRYGSKYARGLCSGPHCRVLVSSGVGLAILPVRFRVPPEIGLVTLRTA